VSFFHLAGKKKKGKNRRIRARIQKNSITYTEKRHHESMVVVADVSVVAITCPLLAHACTNRCDSSA
jgi:hypothetical protein